MTPASLTDRAPGAHKAPMGRNLNRMAARWLMLALGASAMGGCVQVSAPDKPIVIELNINITQEVIYRLAEDAGNTIEENADIF